MLNLYRVLDICKICSKISSISKTLNSFAHVKIAILIITHVNPITPPVQRNFFEIFHPPNKQGTTKSFNNEINPIVEEFPHLLEIPRSRGVPTFVKGEF